MFCALFCSKTLEREREDRLEMMQQYDEKIQALLEVFEEKMQANSKKCQEALSGAQKCAHIVRDMRYESVYMYAKCVCLSACG